MWRIFTTIASTSLFLASATIAVKSNPVKSAAANDQTPTEITRVDLAKHGKKFNRGDRGKILQEQLELSTEQTQQIETIQQQSKSATEALRQQLRENHQQMQSLIASDASDDELRQQHDRIQALRQQLNDSRFETRLQIREVLTPEQRNRLAELMQQRSER